MKPHKIDAPAHWASYLVNGDAEGYDYNEIAEILIWLHQFPSTTHTCVGIDDPTNNEGDAHFMGRFSFPTQGYLLTTLYTYVFLRDSK